MPYLVVVEVVSVTVLPQQLSSFLDIFSAFLVDDLKLAKVGACVIHDRIELQEIPIGSNECGEMPVIRQTELHELYRIAYDAIKVFQEPFANARFEIRLEVIGKCLFHACQIGRQFLDIGSIGVDNLRLSIRILNKLAKPLAKPDVPLFFAFDVPIDIWY